MPPFEPFALERMMSRFEREVAYNLSESGVHPVRFGEILERAPGLLDALVDTALDNRTAAAALEPGLRAFLLARVHAVLAAL